MLHGSKTLNESAGLGGLKRWEKRSGVRTAGRGDAPRLRDDVLRVAEPLSAPGSIGRSFWLS